MEKLDSIELQKALGTLPEWRTKGGALVREWTFTDFKAAMYFVNSVADLAESKGHHPDIDIRYNKVKLALVTHDAGGITAKDTEMCGLIDQISNNP